MAVYYGVKIDQRPGETVLTCFCPLCDAAVGTMPVNECVTYGPMTCPQCGGGIVAPTEVGGGVAVSLAAWFNDSAVWRED